MKTILSPFKKNVFVCENERNDGRASCHLEGTKIRTTLKNIIKSENLSTQIRVSRSGCMDMCGKGPIVLIAPDNIVYTEVKEKDVEQILKELRASI